MTSAQVFRYCYQHRVEIYADRFGQVQLEGPEEVVTDILIKSAGANKRELLYLLKRRKPQTGEAHEVFLPFNTWLAWKAGQPE